MPQPGRNTACPCGSGRKYKHCCQHVLDDEQKARLRLRGAEGALVPRLFTYAVDNFGPGYVDEAWDAFLGWPETPVHPDDSRDFTTTFDPFLVFSFVPDPVAEDLPADWPTTSLAMHYLAHEGAALEGLHRTFLVQACRSPASFFAVEGVEPGRALSLKDMLTGWRVRVLEQSASRTLRVGDITFARVLTCEGTSMLMGACPWVLPASWQLTVIDARRRWRPRRAFTRADLDEYDMELRDLYHEIAHAVQHPPPPVICNTDGEPLELWTLTYTLGVSAHEAISTLLPLATLGTQSDLDNEEREPDGTWRAATMRWVRRGNRRHADWEATVLGSLRVDGDRLTVDVNSAGRRTRIEREIARRLRSGAVQSSAELTPLPDATRAPRDFSGPPPEPRPVELLKVEAELAQQHWVRWVDTRVPALGNRTPRQAARTAPGRERLAALLADFAQRSTAGSHMAPDIGALRRALGPRPGAVTPPGHAWVTRRTTSTVGPALRPSTLLRAA